jgi:hypothetical protein
VLAGSPEEEGVKRTEALAYRIGAQQLDRARASRALTDADILDFGV